MNTNINREYTEQYQYNMDSMNKLKLIDIVAYCQ